MLVLTCAPFVRAQQPVCIHVGEEDLLGTDVYSLKQDISGDLLLTTDRGFIRFDGHDFHFRSNATQKNASLFGLSQHLSGRVWCFNLSGQIFEYRQDSLHLYFELPDSLVSPAMVVLPLENGDLAVSCKRLLRLQANGKWHFIDPNPAHRHGNQVWRLGNGTFAYSPWASKRILLQNGDRIRELPFSKQGLQPSKRSSLLLYQGPAGLVAHQEGTYMLHCQDGDSMRFQKMEARPTLKNEVPRFFYWTAEGEVWVSLLGGGLIRFRKDWTLVDEGRILFREHQISAFMEDREGNLWMATLGDGLLLINSPALELELASPAEGEQLTHLSTDGNGKVFAASNKGNVYAANQSGGLEILASPTSSPIQYLRYQAAGDRLAYGTVFQAHLFNLASGQSTDFHSPSTFKDHVQMGADLSIYPSSNGLFLQSHTSNFPEIPRQLHGFTPQKNNWARLAGLSRTHCVHLDMEREELWVGAATGVQVVSKDSIRMLEWKDRRVIAPEICAQNGSIFIATSQFGVLEVKNGEVLQQIDVEKGLLSNDVRRIRTWKDQLLIGLPKAIHIYHPPSGKMELIAQTEGLSGKVISDFVVSDSALWVASGGSLRILPFERPSSTDIPPLLRISDFRVNGHSQAFTAPSSLATHENQIEFQFIGSAFRHHGLLHFDTWLEGAETEWQRVRNGLRSVRYSSLQAGAYTFHVRAVNGDGVESAVISHRFQIARPLWQQWWFILLCCLGIAGVLTAIFQFRIRSLKRKNAMLAAKQKVEMDLVDSRLTALRSQMNPHFIFNALNSIQEFILLNEKKLAGKYLGKFADLMRIYLNHSRLKTVLLSEEVEALGIYLELEKLRFEESLTYTIEVAEDLSLDSLSIPSLLVQPFVENALKHGLLHRRNDRRLWLRFKMKDSVLTCEVEDNGVGREKAEAMQGERSPKHISYATTSAKNRLQLLNQGRDLAIGIDIDDLVDARGNACGTKVALKIPTFKVRSDQ